jgi:hypothetical protein
MIATSQITPKPLRERLESIDALRGMAAGYAVFVTYLPIADFQRASFLQFSFLRQLPIFALGMVAFFLYDRFIQGKFRPRSWVVGL